MTRLNLWKRTTPLHPSFDRQAVEVGMTEGKKERTVTSRMKVLQRRTILTAGRISMIIRFLRLRDLVDVLCPTGEPKVHLPSLSLQMGVIAVPGRAAVKNLGIKVIHTSQPELLTEV
jgi:hypothetical protein